MIRSPARFAVARCVVVAVVIVLAWGAHAQAAGPAAGADPCPEPNDAFQQACLLSSDIPAVGYLSASGDVDAYRLTPLDFGAQAHLELTDSPPAYRLELADWNGRIFANSADTGVLDATLGPPGVYYVFVWSPDGTASDDTPYHLAAQVAYPGGPPPNVVLSRDWGLGLLDRTRETPIADYIWSGGRFTIQMKRPRGVALAPNGVELTGLRDFTWTFDARLVNDASQAGFGVQFRHDVEPQLTSFLTLDVDVGSGTATLNKSVNGTVSRLAQATSDAVDVAGGVNRTTIRAIGSTIGVNINGQDVLAAQDDDVRTGALRIAAFSRGETPPTFNFDNLLATSPPSQ